MINFIITNNYDHFGTIIVPLYSKKVIMKQSIKSLIGYGIKETDGELGKLEEFYFDDLTWTIRYLIVKTGTWFSERRVLISPVAVMGGDLEDNGFFVNLTKEQIKNSPDIDTDKPVSRQQEEQLSRYYPWGIYWGNEPDEHGAGIFGMMPGDLYDDEVDDSSGAATAENSKNNDLHLRSTKEVTGYMIHARDGEIGKVVDYIIDETNWKIKFLVVDTGSWLNSKKVLLPTSWITNVNWKNSIVVVSVSTEEVKNSPHFNASDPVNENYEHTLYDYYGREVEN